MPRQPLRATSATAAAAAAAVAAAANGDSNEPIRATFCTPIRPVIEPPTDDSDNSLRTARCASDKISRDSLVDVVFSMKAVAKHDVQCCRQRRKLQQQPQLQQLDGGDSGGSGGRQSETSALSSDDGTPTREKTDKTQVAEPKRWRSDAESGRLIRNRERDRQLTTLNERDPSELIQMLIGHAFGSDCLKVRSLRKLVDTTSVNISAYCGGGSRDNRGVQFDSDGDATAIAAAADQSEMMTLTCGDLTKTLLTHLQAPNGSCRAGAAEAAAAIATNAAKAGIVATATPVATERTRCRSDAARDSHRSNNCSSLSLSHSEAVTAVGLPDTNGSAAHEEAIPASDRIGGKLIIVGGGGGGDCGGSNGNKKGTDITVESTVVVDFGDFVNDVVGSACGDRVGGGDGCSESGTEVCTCDIVRRRTHRNRNRFGRLRTPEICKRTTTDTGSMLSRSSSGTTTATATAAEAEWDESGVVVRSMSERHRIDTSEGSQDVGATLGSQWKRRRDSTVQQEAKQRTPEKPRKKEKPQKSREKLLATSSPPERQQKKKKKPLRKHSPES